MKVKARMRQQRSVRLRKIGAAKTFSRFVPANKRGNKSPYTVGLKTILVLSEHCARSPLPAALVRRGIGRLLCRCRDGRRRRESNPMPSAAMPGGRAVSFYLARFNVTVAVPPNGVAGSIKLI